MHNDPMSESASAVDSAAQAASWRAPMLRFARLQLQLCLHQNWFESEKASP